MTTPEPTPDAAAPDPADGPRTPKSERTRQQIVAAALTLFREQGYQGTTMRAVAASAGVSVGNAYYYFSSKEELIQGFYDQMVTDQAAACVELFAASTDFASRLRGALLAWLDAAEPYHEFAGRFFATAAQPDNPLSPFSQASSPARDASIALYRELIGGARVTVGDELAATLPELLWLYQLGVVLYWVHDSSEGTARTRLLIEHTVPMVSRLVRLSRLPVIRPLSRQTAELVGLLRGPRAG
ncbi:MAG TPA: TetR family transcriptional regulator [Pseudonocardia sp.]|nr:TetR family transcriptional regulator [Pseudonocardia sp.]